MKKISRSIKAAMVVLGLVAMAVSCNKSLDVPSSRLVGEKDYWNNVEDARSALMGVYGLSRAALTDNAAFWMYGEFRKGDFSAITRTDLKAIVNNDLNVSLPMLQSLKNWRRFYAAINAANLFIERSGEIIKKDAYYPESTNNVDIAQVRAMRAFLYFYMVRIWGDVPLVVSSFDGKFPQLARTPQQQVLAFAEKELIEAAKNLPVIYNSLDPLLGGLYYNRSYSFWKGSLFNKISAYAVLAHIAAWQQRYNDVMSYTQFILDNYQTADISFTNSTELLCESDSGFFYRMGPSQMLNFSFDYNNGEGITAGHLEDYVLAKPITSKLMPDLFIQKDTIISMFNWTGDERFSIDLATGYPKTEYYFVNYNTNTPVFSKIKVLQDGKLDKGTFRMFNATMMFTRMEELVLLRAEAAMVTNNTPEAINWLRQVMVSRGIPSPTFNGVDILDEIFKERRRELLGEGWRWYDQVRYARLRPAANPAFAAMVQNGAIYWPVAEDVMSANPKLTQNSYWNK